MIFKAPFYELQAEFFKLVTNADEATFPVFDSGIGIKEIANANKKQENTNYGIIADVTGTTVSTKTDSIIWNMSIRIELFSRYNGRKEIAEMIQNIGEIVTKYEDAFAQNMCVRGFNILNIQLGATAIGAPLNDGAVNWQNGFITINFTVAQIDNDDGTFGGIY